MPNFKIFNDYSERWIDFKTPHQDLLFASFVHYVQIDVGTTTVKDLKEKIANSLNAGLLSGTRLLTQNTWIESLSPFTADDIIISPEKNTPQMSWKDDVVLGDEHLIRLGGRSMHTVPNTSLVVSDSSVDQSTKERYRPHVLCDAEIKISTEVLAKKLTLTQKPPVLSKNKKIF